MKKKKKISHVLSTLFSLQFPAFESEVMYSIESYFFPAFNPFCPSASFHSSESSASVAFSPRFVALRPVLCSNSCCFRPHNLFPNVSLPQVQTTSVILDILATDQENEAGGDREWMKASLFLWSWPSTEEMRMMIIVSVASHLAIFWRERERKKKRVMRKKNMMPKKKGLRKKFFSGFFSFFSRSLPLFSCLRQQNVLGLENSLFSVKRERAKSKRKRRKEFWCSRHWKALEGKEREREKRSEITPERKRHPSKVSRIFSSLFFLFPFFSSLIFSYTSISDAWCDPFKKFEVLSIPLVLYYVCTSDTSVPIWLDSITDSSEKERRERKKLIRWMKHQLRKSSQSSRGKKVWCFVQLQVALKDMSHWINSLEITGREDNLGEITHTCSASIVVTVNCHFEFLYCPLILFRTFIISSHLICDLTQHPVKGRDKVNVFALSCQLRKKQK